MMFHGEDCGNDETGLDEFESRALNPFKVTQIDTLSIGSKHAILMHL